MGAVSTIKVRVCEHRPSHAKGPYRVLTEDGTGDLTLVFFRANGNWIEKALPVGAIRWVSGLIEIFDYYKQMVHPQHILDEEGLKSLPPVEPVYGLTEGLFPRVMAKAAAGALARLPDFSEWLNPSFARGNGWVGFGEAIKRLHQPQAPADLKPESTYSARLAYDECCRTNSPCGWCEARPGASRPPAAGDAARDEDPGKSAVRAHRRPDPGAGGDFRRHGLRQTHVAAVAGRRGSGKTVVALLAMAQAIEAGRQAALMAPTEILARQHFETIKPLAEAAGLTVALATGRDKTTERRATLADLASGALDIVVGTHALVQEDFAFRDLGLAVIDEQHRFGVQQRLALGEKNAASTCSR